MWYFICGLEKNPVFLQVFWQPIMVLIFHRITTIAFVSWYLASIVGAPEPGFGWVPSNYVQGTSSKSVWGTFRLSEFRLKSGFNFGLFFAAHSCMWLVGRIHIWLVGYQFQRAITTTYGYKATNQAQCRRQEVSPWLQGDDLERVTKFMEWYSSQ